MNTGFNTSYMEVLMELKIPRSVKSRFMRTCSKKNALKRSKTFTICILNLEREI